MAAGLRDDSGTVLNLGENLHRKTNQLSEHSSQAFRTSFSSWRRWSQIVRAFPISPVWRSGLISSTREHGRCPTIHWLAL